jgi:hypothetical protein
VETQVRITNNRNFEKDQINCPKKPFNDHLFRGHGSGHGSSLDGVDGRVFWQLSKADDTGLNEYPTHPHTLANPRLLSSFDGDLSGTGGSATPHSFHLVAAARPTIPPYASVQLEPPQMRACRAYAEIAGHGAADDAPTATWYPGAPGVSFHWRGCERPHR